MPAIAYKPNDKDRAVVKALAAYGVPQEQIGARIGISHVTLRKYYQSELDLSAMEANAKVAETCYQMATGGQHPAATFFWLKTRAGWRETDRLEHSGPNGGPIEIHDSAREELASRIAGLASRISQTGSTQQPK